MVKSDIIVKLKQKYPHLKTSQIIKILDVFFDNITENLIKKKSIELRDFGRWSVRVLKENYNSRNPKTNEIIYVPQRKKISFKMSKKLRNRINSKK